MSPRVTIEQIESLVVREAYYVFSETTVTVCCLTLKNGFNVVGESACASAENFNAEIGKRHAREKAIDKVWALEGYLLREQLSKA